MIYCLTQHHTGTWSTLAWILKHQGVDGFLTREHIFDILEPVEPRDESGVYPVHPMESGELVEKFHPRLVFQEHIRLDPTKMDRIDGTQVMICLVNPTVIPIRDPLASLVSYQRRAERAGRTPETGFAPRSHVDTWVALAQTWEHVLKKFAHVRFMPWDLLGLGDRFEVAEKLFGISTALGLRDGTPSLTCAREMIHNNDLGTYPLKEAYQEGDLEKVREGVSEDAVNLLISKRPLIEPFLEFLGYSDLMWWT